MGQLPSPPPLLPQGGYGFLHFPAWPLIGSEQTAHGRGHLTSPSAAWAVTLLAALKVAA